MNRPSEGRSGNRIAKWYSPRRPPGGTGLASARSWSQTSGSASPSTPSAAPPAAPGCGNRRSPITRS